MQAALQSEYLYPPLFIEPALSYYHLGSSVN